MTVLETRIAKKVTLERFKLNRYILFLVKKLCRTMLIDNITYSMNDITLGEGNMHV